MASREKAKTIANHYLSYHNAMLEFAKVSHDNDPTIPAISEQENENISDLLKDFVFIDHSDYESDEKAAEKRERSWSEWFPGKYLKTPLKTVIKPLIYVVSGPFKVVGHFTGKQDDKNTKSYYFHLNNSIIRKFFNYQEDEQL